MNFVNCCYADQTSFGFREWIANFDPIDLSFPQLVQDLAALASSVHPLLLNLNFVIATNVIAQTTLSDFSISKFILSFQMFLQPNPRSFELSTETV